MCSLLLGGVAVALLGLPAALADPYYSQHLKHVTLKSPAQVDFSLAAQHKLFLYGPLVPPAEWKCWGMGNGQRDWRNGDLAGCRMFTAHEAGFTGDDIREFIPGLVENGTQITYVDLAGSALVASDPAAQEPVGAEALAELLRVPLIIEEINLENNRFTATEAQVFAKALEGSCPARLRLGWNELGMAGAAALAAGFGTSGSGLRELSLENNAVADAGAASLAAALEKNPELHTVCTTSTRLSVCMRLLT